jgi:adenine-specific DNA-methyltransferase
MATRKAPAKKIAPQVESVQHKDKRLNIPTEEQRDFVADAERDPIPIEYDRPLLYPRDPDADPQLVWRGKDGQDQNPLIVQAVPLYIQEKIEPRSLVEDLRRTSEKNPDIAQPSMFKDFDGLEGFEQIEFYEHAANWSNRLILGDALLVMNSLGEKERLAGQVQAIYIDPPYGIRFGSNWQVSTRNRNVKDGIDASRQPEQVKAFRDTWQDGVHTYLTYLRDRLSVALSLLADSGSLFVQIGDENVHLVRSVLDEVFGPQNFCAIITFKTTSSASGDLLAGTTDFLLWYAKDKGQVKYRQLYRDRELGGIGSSAYTWLQLPDGTRRRMTSAERADAAVIPEGARAFRLDNLTSSRPARDTDLRSYEMDGKLFTPGAGTFKTNLAGMNKLKAANRLAVAGNTLTYVRFADDFPLFPITNAWDDTVTAGFAADKIYVVQTNTKVIERCLLMTTDPGDLVLDPTCGSGSTAFVAEKWGRRWVTIDTSRVALALTRTRLMAARFPFFLLADSAEGAVKEEELTGHPQDRSWHSSDVRQGFVARRVPHIMLSSVVRNERITENMSEQELARVLAQGAEQEMVVDQPYENQHKIRVSGRFTVESLSPHRNLDSGISTANSDSTSFISTILDNLRASGVQNTFKGERLTFDMLEPLPSDGTLQASGTMTDSDGEVRAVAVAIGPEHGTVSPDMVKDAAREALKGAGFDLLVYCGFAYEAYTSETAKEFAPQSDGFATAEQERQMGKLRVLLAM